jgi:archaemetzincin
MPRKVVSSKSSCAHRTLQFSSTSHAAQVGYNRPNIQQRDAATTPSGSVKAKIKDKRAKSEANSPDTFPAPLILPDDDLALDPTYPPQSLRSWIRGKDRNKITPAQRTIYLAAPPRIDLDIDFLEKWALLKPASATKIKQPDAQHVLDYLKAFYHGLPVKLVSCITRCLQFYF